MKSIENPLITAVYDALRTGYPGIAVFGDATTIAAKFPCVSLYEIDNTTAADTRDTSGMEKHSDASYQVDVYSNAETGRKTECRLIMAIIDDLMIGYGLDRTSMLPTPNLNDNNIYRITARYTARIGNNNTIYRR